jgi:hypothetical protein
VPQHTHCVGQRLRATQFTAEGARRVAVERPADE